MSKYSKKAKETIREKLHKMSGEDRPEKQKIAIALSEARMKGLKVPPPPSDKKTKSRKN